VRGLIRAFRHVFRLGIPYFNSEEKWWGRGLLLAVVAIELGQVALTVQLNIWNRRFFNALQLRQLDVWLHQLLVFSILAVSLMLTTMLILVCQQTLLIRWRRWMTERYLRRWLDGSNHYRVMVSGHPVDNPDQRISMDIHTFLTQSMTIGLGILRSVTTLGSFVFILWGLSATTPLPIYGHNYAFPGFLVVAALAYASVGTLLTHLAGRKLIKLNFMQERYEADFRFDLVRVRENSEQIALLKGEPVEERRLMGRYGNVFDNSFRLMWRTLKMTLVTAGWGQITFVLPGLLIAPAYFAGVIQMGLLFQIQNAFGTVERSLSFFMVTYTTLAAWKATVDRLVGFQESMTEAEDAAAKRPVVDVSQKSGCKRFEVDALDVHLPDGRTLVEACKFAVEPGDSVLVSGPSGIGKSTMFRALAGIWPFGSGTVTFPKDARVMIVPQRPYLPLGTLATAIAFPEAPDNWTREDLEEAVEAAGLGAFLPRLDVEDLWSQRLSLGEQQRVAIARALLHKPDVLFLDESTASLDEPSEKHLYDLIRTRLPKTTLVSIGHRSSLKAYHGRHFKFVREGDSGRLVEDDLGPSSPEPALSGA
jgi:putative ATP-binding cassette transporter